MDSIALVDQFKLHYLPSITILHTDQTIMSESKYIGGMDSKGEGKYDDKADDKDGRYPIADEKGYDDYDSKSQTKDELPVPIIEISDIKIDGGKRLVTDPIDLSITFTVDRLMCCDNYFCTSFSYETRTQRHSFLIEMLSVHIGLSSC